MDAGNTGGVIARDGVSDFALGPAINEIRHAPIVDASGAFRGKWIDLKLHRQSKPNGQAHQKAIARFKRDGAFSRDHVNLSRKSPKTLRISLRSENIETISS